MSNTKLEALQEAFKVLEKSKTPKGRSQAQERHAYLIRLGMEALDRALAEPEAEQRDLRSDFHRQLFERMAQAAQVWAADLED